MVCWVASCYQSPVNKSINGEYDDHHAVAEVKLYGDDDDFDDDDNDDDDVDDVDQIRGGGKQVD